MDFLQRYKSNPKEEEESFQMLEHVDMLGQKMNLNLSLTLYKTLTQKGLKCKMRNFKILGKRCRRKSARPRPRQSVLRLETKNNPQKEKPEIRAHQK